ncbi:MULTISPECIES: hypothetical protein [unclassified Shinella]|uniref:hypothetical protein n=1 Tax=unclassified Shinella TaxID=2643062 RepID=UPI00225DA174|nr:MULTISPECIES: hypothetical protein [unclassified Shinella]MCO5140861.1 hypothetical protein [Shinella sp.]MDC7256449.1 hypothetical protein [Shinella sp. YE25]CAI0339317.1 conserved hypothetical protein [Rhizobiaceae bacterium]CAK7257725.1 protein of unknown function [Shinella sp. WSC3-e]
MRPPLNLPAADDVTRAAMWLADIARWPESPADLLIHRFDLKVWQARKAVEKARKMQLLRRVS